MNKYSALLFILLFFSGNGFSQIKFSSIKVDEWVKKNFSGQGVVVGNVQFRGYPLSALSFTSTANVLQVPKGLILSSGNSFNVAGYNNSHNQSSTFGDILSPQIDADLSLIVKGKLYDICSIEFDFVPLDNSIQFNYQFGSDEYPEYVDSPYNDVFAFIVSDDSTSKNIALIPETDTPVSINTVNFKLNQNYFLDNNLYKQVLIKREEPLKLAYRGTMPGRVLRGIASLFTSTEALKAERVVIKPDPELIKTLDPNLYRNLRYDGITKKLVAQTFVTPYKKYHLKIVIADVADNIYDSGVFLEDKSLAAHKDAQQPGFVDYPDLSKVIDVNLILQGKTLKEILPADYQQFVSKSAETKLAGAVPESSSPQEHVEIIPSEKQFVKTPEKEALRQELPESRRAEFELSKAVILFDFDQSEITEREMIKLRLVVEKYKQHRKDYSIKISGHTDNYGDLDYNYALSARRNKAVIDAISELLDEKISIPALSKSYTQPVADNDTDEGRQLNRRVELVFVRKN